MAKKKEKEPVIEAVEKEEIEIKEAEKPVETSSDDKFVARTLLAINKMQNPAKAKRLANRLLRKRK